MRRLVIGILLFTYAFMVHSAPTPLPLECTVSISSFKDIPDQILFFDAELMALKHKPGGTKKLAKINDYEFWVMTHTVQKLNQTERIVNFQVAIRHRPSQLFFHALSQSALAEKEPLSARASLVDYYPDSLLEKGEILFSCKRKL